MRPANAVNTCPNTRWPRSRLTITLVVNQVGRGLAERALRHPGGDSLLFQISEEAIEACTIVASGRARGGRGPWSGRNRHRLAWRREELSRRRLWRAQHRRQQSAEPKSCGRRNPHACTDGGVKELKVVLS
jgi:hypothetical protein